MSNSRRRTLKSPPKACARCRRPMPVEMAGWNVVLKAHVATGYLCPQCQTAQENAEAEINCATGIRPVLHDGRLVGVGVASLTIDEILEGLIARCEAAFTSFCEEVIQSGEGKALHLGALARQVADDLPIELRPTNPKFDLHAHLRGILAAIASGEMYEPE